MPSRYMTTHEPAPPRSAWLAAFEALTPSDDWQLVPVPVGTTALKKYRAYLKTRRAQARLSPEPSPVPGKVLLEVRLIPDAGTTWAEAVLAAVDSVPEGRWVEVPVPIGHYTWHQRGFYRMRDGHGVLTRRSRQATPEEVRALLYAAPGADYIITLASRQKGLTAPAQP